MRNQGNGETTHFTDVVTNEVTHCVSKMHEWIMKAWMPLFRMYEFQPEPSWSAFRTEYENELREWFAECPKKYSKKGSKPVSEADRRTNLEERMAGGQQKPTYYQADPSRQDKKFSKQLTMVGSGHTPSVLHNPTPAKNR